MTTNPSIDALEGPLPRWEGFERDYIATGIPCRLVMNDAPRVELVVGQGGSTLSALFEMPGSDVMPPSPLATIQIAEVMAEGRRSLQVTAADPKLFRNFYLLVADVTVEILTSGARPSEALRSSLRRWHALLREARLLTLERQSGLMGELWLLHRLIPALGAASLDAWTGPSGQAHDFRMEGREFEVKTSAVPGKTHIINGLGQLVPSVGRELFILSLEITDAGTGGRSLAEAVVTLQNQFAAWTDATEHFLELLEAVGYNLGDAPYYGRRRQLRSRPSLIPVATGCPRLVPDALRSLPEEFSAYRIRAATYEVNVDGLGYTDGDSDFLEILPREPSQADLI